MMRCEEFDDEYGYYIHCGDEDDGGTPLPGDAEWKELWEGWGDEDAPVCIPEGA